MRVEQRIGRIDRIGQKFSQVRIHNFYYDGTVEAKVYNFSLVAIMITSRKNLIESP